MGQLYLDGGTPYIELDAAHEKSKEGNTLPMRADLANNSDDHARPGKLAT